MSASGRFADRAEAGKALSRTLKGRDLTDAIVLAMPRGGIPVGLEIALAHSLPLDLVFVRKIGVPFQRELAAAAVVDGGAQEIVFNDDVMEQTGLTRAEIETQAEIELAEIARRRNVYLAGKSSPPLEGRTLILVDDGIATGASVRAAIAALGRKNPKRLILAVPVAPDETLRLLRPLVDELICLMKPDPFLAIGFHYRDFHQIGDAEVVKLLKTADAARSATAPSAHGSDGR
ncbi:MAG: phosphoribosyltransferase [Hyphomicrobiaceae bacterium]